MSEKAEFEVALKDHMSGPAKEAGAALHGLSSEVGHVAESTHHLDHEVERLEFHEILKDAFKEVTGGMREFGSGLRNLELGEAIRGATEAASGLAQTLDLLYPGLGQVTAAAVRTAGAVGELAAGLVDTALEVTEFNERTEATFEALGEGPGAGKATLGFLNEMATQLPQSRKQLAEWTEQFEAMGETDLGALKDDIMATASAQAIMGDKGATTYQELTKRVNVAIEAHSGLKLAERSLKQLYDAGINVTDVAGRMGVSVTTLKAQLKSGTADAEKFGEAMRASLLEKGEKPLEAMGNKLGTLKTKLSETIGHLFDDVDTSPILDAIKSVIDLGDQGEPSGQQLKAGITGGLNAIIKGIGEVVHEGELMFLDLEIGWLKNKTTIMSVVHNVEDVAGAFLKVAGAVGSVVGAIGGAGSKVTDFIGKLSFMGENAQLDYEAKARAGQGPAALPAHASGGLVTGISGGIATVRPAPGEGLASIGPGERIIPRDAYARAPAMMAAAASNDNSRSNVVHIEHIHIEAPAGVTHAEQLTVTGLTIALERMQLMAGR